jgi:hypothetical protein
LHAGQEALDGQKGRRQIGIDGRVPIPLAERLERGGWRRAAASVGDEDADGTKSSLNAFPQRFDLIECGHVRGDGHHLPAITLDVGVNRGKGRLVATVQCNGGAGVSKPGRDRRPNPS